MQKSKDGAVQEKRKQYRGCSCTKAGKVKDSIVRAGKTEGRERKAPGAYLCGRRTSV
jgi:hypothetical protein